MKTNAILRTMFVLLFMICSTGLTDADIGDHFRDGHFYVIHWLESGLIVENDNGLMVNTVAPKLPKPPTKAVSHVYNATIGMKYYIKSGGKECSVIASGSDVKVIVDMINL